MHGLLFLDDNQSPLSPLVTWADERSQLMAAELQNTSLGQEIYYRSGTPVHPMSPLCKLLWFKQHQPELLAGASKIVSIKEYFVFQITGQFLIDHSIASATGLFDLFTRNWYEPALKLAGITPSQLSNPVSTTALLPPIKSESAQRLGIPLDVSWVIGASDGCLANLGVHANKPSQAALTIGTSGAIRVTTKEPLVDEKRRLFTYILDDEHYIVGGSINNGGIMLKWYQEHLMGQSGPDTSLKDNLSATAAIPAGSDGLICLPYLLGERAPHWNSFDRGVFFGVQFQHTAAHFLKSMLEGITLNLYQIGEAIEDTCGPFDSILANGGVLQSPDWLQIMADVFDKKVVITPGQDSSAMGAILLTMQALGIERKTERDVNTNPPDQHILPNQNAHATYQRVLPVFSDLYDKLQADFVRLQTI